MIAPYAVSMGDLLVIKMQNIYPCFIFNPARVLQGTIHTGWVRSARVKQAKLV